MTRWKQGYTCERCGQRGTYESRWWLTVVIRYAVLIWLHRHCATRPPQPDGKEGKE